MSDCRCRLCHLWRTRDWYRDHYGPGGPHDGVPAQAAARTPLPVCANLGDAVPGETGPCGQRLRRCSEFGTCTVTCCDKSAHWCHDPTTGERCREFVTKYACPD